MRNFFWTTGLCSLSLLANNVNLTSTVLNSDSGIVTKQKEAIDDVTKYDYWGKLFFVDKESRGKRVMSLNTSDFELPTNAKNFKITSLNIEARYTMRLETTGYVMNHYSYSDIVASRNFNAKELRYLNYSLVMENETLQFAWEAWRYGPHAIDLGGDYEVQVWIDGFTGFSAKNIKWRPMGVKVARRYLKASFTYQYQL